MLRNHPEENVVTKAGASSLLVHQMRDYCQVGIDLVWQRQIIFVAALALASFYYSLELAAALAILIIISEVFDFWLFRRILSIQQVAKPEAAFFLILLCVSTVVSASIIVSYAVGISILQGPTTHFMPLFFLFAAALFAAMNNHQLLPILIIRLAIYGSAFLFIPIRDVWITDAKVDSELWAQLFTSLFVVFFMLDCSRIYLRLYRSQLEQLRALKKEYERSKIAYKAKTEFVSTMSYELRTPLTSIKGSVDMVNSGMLGTLPKQAASAVSVAKRNCDRLLKLINEILDLQSIDSNKMTFNLEPINVEKTLERSLLDINPFAEKFNIKLTLDHSNSDPKIYVDGDRLSQVFTNVLSNAIKFSPEGSEVRVYIEECRERVKILFADEGIGLSESDYDKVFDAFSQIDASDTRKIGGTGLGMNISKRIIEEFSGEIYFEGNSKQGTTFIIDLPRA